MTDEKVPPEIQIYANCMEKVRQRVGVIIWAIQTVRTLGVEHFMWTELIFVQFRKIKRRPPRPTTRTTERFRDDSESGCSYAVPRHSCKYRWLHAPATTNHLTTNH